MVKSKIANCEFSFKCPRSWDELSRTESEVVRFCNACEKGVYLAEDQETFGFLAATGKCVAIHDVSRIDSYDSDGLTLGIPYLPDDYVALPPQWPLHLDCAHDSLRGNAPGCLLNNDEAGSDGNYYSIDRSSEGKNLWDLFQCVPEHFFAPGFQVSTVGHAITVEELYAKLEAVNIFIQSHEAIALGLPYHGDNY